MRWLWTLKLSAMSPFDTAHTTSCSPFIETTGRIFLVPFSRYGKLFVESGKIFLFTFIWRCRWKFTMVFGVGKLMSLFCHAALFAYDAFSRSVERRFCDRHTDRQTDRQTVDGHGSISRGTNCVRLMSRISSVVIV